MYSRLIRLFVLLVLSVVASGAFAQLPNWFLIQPIQLLAFPYFDGVIGNYRYLCYRNPQNYSQWAGLKFNANKLVKELDRGIILTNSETPWNSTDNAICQNALPRDGQCRKCH